MPRPLHEASSFSVLSQPSRPSEDHWEATRALNGGPATRMFGDKEAYLENSERDVGRNLGDGNWEMFVVTSPGEAMRMQLDHLRPEYIAIHDVGTATSRRLLSSLAAALGGKVHKLVIRRQGHGVALATLEFVELPVPGGVPLRVYTTEVDADTQARHELAHVLLGHSRLAVAMAGDLPAHAMAAALKPLNEAMMGRHWINRNMLMLPLGASSTVATQASQLGAGSGIVVRTTPQVTRPADAWNFISGAWNRLREALADSGVQLPIIGGASTPQRRASDPPVAPLPMQPMPELPKAGATPPAASSPFAAYVQQCLQIKGMVTCCVFELATQRTLAHAGSRPGPAALASQGAKLHAALVETGRALGLAPGQPDVALTLASHHVLMRALPRHPGLVMHAVLDSSVANLTLARLQIGRLDETLQPQA